MNSSKTIHAFEKNYDEKHIVRWEDVKSRFKNHYKIKDNPIIYTTFIRKISPMQLGLTEINSGNLKGEFYMTRGHVHAKKTPELYILLEGEGILLMQKESKSKVIKLKKGEIAYIPESYAHRLINTGNKILKVLTIYHEDSKPNYNIKFKKRFLNK